MMDNTPQVTKYQLQNGDLIPLIGLGTFKVRCNINQDLVYDTLDTAIATGYRLIDTASCYRNEKDIGEALRKLYVKHDVKRSDLFITSKIAPKDLSYEGAITSCMLSLTDLQTDYLDLCLIHWPGRSKLQPDDEQHKVYRREAWKALEELVTKGCIRNIGVSNYTVEHIQELLEYAVIAPSVLQVEFHPHLYQEDLLSFCSSHHVFLQAYSSLGTGELLSVEKVNELAKKYNKTSAQLLLRWATQLNIGVLPKSCSPAHVISNHGCTDFVIVQDDMIAINQMNINKHYCWDPTKIK